MRALLHALLTHDKSPFRFHDASHVLTVDGGEGRRQFTPEGYLLCREVPIARLGDMLYAGHELPVLKAGADGMIRVTRDADSLFSPETIASFNLKSVTNNHPPGHNLDPKTWRQFTVGVMSNVRRGTTTETKDCLVADVLVTDPEAIRVALAHDCEVSAGYVAEYAQDAPGRARQTNIVGNHLALVPRGRCGPRCAIGDAADINLLPEPAMPAPAKKPAVKVVKNRAFVERMKKFFTDSADGIEEALGMEGGEEEGEDEGKSGDIHIHVNGAGAAEPAAPAVPAVPGAAEPSVPGLADPTQKTPEDRLTALEGMMAQILAKLSSGNTPTPADPPEPGDPKDGGDPPAPPSDDDPTKKIPTGDSAALSTSWQELIAEAALLQPALKHAVTFDSAAPRLATIDSMCAVRRSTIMALYGTVDGKALVNAAAGLPENASIDIGSYKCDAMAVLFSTAAKTRKLMNNAAVAHDANRIPKQPVPTSGRYPQVRNPGELNSLYAKHYGRDKH